MDASVAMTLLADVRLARHRLPSQHIAVLDALGVQETVCASWPGPVLDLYETVRMTPPDARALRDAAGLWLPALRTAAFNGPFLRAVTDGLDEASRREFVANVAWHEYGHALSLALSTADQRRRGSELLKLAPDVIQRQVGQHGYRSDEIFDELIAGVYALLVGGVPRYGYGLPRYLNKLLFDEFKEIIPWPPTQ